MSTTDLEAADSPGSSSVKKHKKHKRDKHEDTPPASLNASRLKLILRVGGSSTPERSESPGPSTSLPVNVSVSSYDGDDSQQSAHSVSMANLKKARKKEKKKKKDKKHKHHHKEKKRKEKIDSTLADSGSTAVDSPLSITNEVAPVMTPVAKSFEETVSPLSQYDTEDSQGSFLSNTAKSSKPKPPADNKSLYKLLDHLIRALEKKDPQQFFAWPVTDKIAPGYSKIIQSPMDFSTMKSKVDEAVYETLPQFIEDFRLMCINAMTYNHPDTVYYKTARKLLQTGIKLLGPEKIRSLLPLIPSIRLLNEDQLGFSLFTDHITLENAEMSQSEDENMETINDPTQSIHYMPPHPNDPPDLCGAFTDDLTSEEILQQARIAAKEAAHKLASKKPNHKLGFIRQKQDGSTSLSILASSSGVVPGTKEIPLAMGALSGKLTHGSTQMMGFKEDKRNITKTVKPLAYGAFSSYAPNQDSTFANVTSEESNLLHATYGEERSIQYAESMIEFAKGCDYAVHMVDEILDTITKGEHSKTVNLIEERKKMEEEEAKLKKEKSMLKDEVESYWSDFSSIVYANNVKTEAGQSANNLNLDEVKSLKELGIDTGFVDALELEIKNSFNQRLKETASLIEELQKIQNRRLSQPTMPLPPYVLAPSEAELRIAMKVRENLTELTKQVKPGSVVCVDEIRKAMGIDLEAFECATAESLSEAAKAGPSSNSIQSCNHTTPAPDSSMLSSYSSSINTPPVEAQQSYGGNSEANYVEAAPTPELSVSVNQELNVKFEVHMEN